MPALTFQVPWEALCSDNRKYVAGYVLSPAYRASKTLIGALAMQAARKAKWKRQEGMLRLEVVVREPDRRKRDLNWSKNLKDGITESGAIWWDDSQVRDERWRFSLPPDKATAGATITVHAITQEDLP